MTARMEHLADLGVLVRIVEDADDVEYPTFVQYADNLGRRMDWFEVRSPRPLTQEDWEHIADRVRRVVSGRA